MSKKRYTIRYTKGKMSTITAASNWPELIDLLKGDAAGAFVEIKISEGMPLIMHNAIADHNSKLKSTNSQP